MAEGRYVKTVKICLNLDRVDENSWINVSDSVYSLRNDIICTVCRKLALKPVRPVTSDCYHAVCKNCVEKRISMGFDCARCGDYNSVEEHARLRLLLHCYKKICELLLTSKFIRGWKNQDLTESMKRFLKVIHEGAFYKDTSPIKEKPLDQLSANVPMPSTPVNDSKTNHAPKIQDDEINTTHADVDIIPSVKPELQMGLTQTTVQRASNLMTFLNALEEISDEEFVESAIEQIIPNIPKRCRCGQTPKTDKTQCCSSETCPCYVKGKGCASCRCKGCKNPIQSVIGLTPIKQNLVLGKKPRIDVAGLTPIRSIPLKGKMPQKKLNMTPVKNTLVLGEGPRKRSSLNLDRSTLVPCEGPPKKVINLIPVRSTLVLGEGPQANANDFISVESTHSADDNSSEDENIPDFSSTLLADTVSMEDFVEMSDSDIEI